MMDTFTEQLEVRKNSPKDIIKTIIYLLLIFLAPGLCLLLGAVFNQYFYVVAICAFFFAVYGSYYVVTGLYTEYEYAVTNSNITIDKIIGKRSRKRIISVDIKKFSTLAKLKDCDLTKKSYRKIFGASITPNGDDVFAAEMHLDKFGGECLLLFSPNQKTLEAMLPTLRNNIRLDLRKQGLVKAASEKPAPKTAPTIKPIAKKPETKAELSKSDEKESDTQKDSKKPEIKADTATSDVKENDTAKDGSAKASNNSDSQKKPNNKGKKSKKSKK